MVEYSMKMDKKLRFALVLVFVISTIQMVWMGAHAHKVFPYFVAAVLIGAITRVTWIKSQN